MSNTSRAATRRRPAWRLILLTGLVLLAHWVLLRAAPLALAAHASPDAGASWAFATRTIAPPATADVVAGSPREPTTVPARRPPEQRVAAAPKPAKRYPQQENAAPAPEKHGTPATESIASNSPMEAPAAFAPTLLAASAPDTPPPVTTTATPTVTPPAAKAVRKFVFPPSARLEYQVKGDVKNFPFPVYAKGELLWTQDGKTYNARMEVSNFLMGARVQTSAGQLTAHGLEPTRFGDKVKSEVAAHFDHEKNKVTFSANTPDAPLLPGAQDQLSVFMQLAAMLAAEPHGFPHGTTLPVQAVGPRSAEAWVFTVGASEKLVLPGGTLEAVRLWRDPLGTYDPKVEIWLAPDVGYLPVRIRLAQANGDVVDQLWRATLPP